MGLKNYFLSGFNKSKIDIQKKANILLFLDFTLIFFALTYSVIALFILKDLKLSIIAVVGSLLAIFSIYFLKKSNYDMASLIIIIVFWIAVTLLAVLPILSSGRSISIMTRNTLLIFFIIVLFGEKKYQLIMVFLVNIIVLSLIQFNIIGSGVDKNLLSIGNFFNEIIILIIAFVVSLIKITITQSIIAYEQNISKKNREKFENLEQSLNESRKSLNIGESLIKISEKTTNMTEQIKIQINNLSSDIKKLLNEINLLSEYYKSINEFSDRVKNSIENENKAIVEQSGFIDKITKNIKNISDVSTNKRSQINKLNEASLSGKKQINITVNSINEINEFAKNIMSVIDIIV
ncbi:MAG TPA: hypothetical protein PK771_06645, partial [Spirochaetota bacterium]|nr:hypothetical protein [Spirochaetota bacterium]